MSEDTLKRFGVEPCAPDGAIIMGFDNGAGNCCAALMETSVIGGCAMRRMSFDNAGKTTNLYTAYATAGDAEIIGEEALRAGGDKRVYVGFKRPPGTDSARQSYGGEFGAPTYEELMRRFFQKALRDAVKYNKGYLDSSGKKRILLFVGRPASQLWQEHEMEYQQLLLKNLHVPEFDGKIDIIVYSEAMAALAYEYSKKQISREQPVLIIDCGSSTFDAVLVRGGALVGEYSRQLGAGEIEKLMLDLLLAEGDEASMNSVDARLRMRREKSARIDGAGRWAECVAELRQRKEDFYGTDGDNGSSSNAYTVRLTHDGGAVRKARLDIDGNTMHKVVCDIPIRILDSYPETGAVYGTSEYKSFYDATQAFMRGVKRMCARHGVGKVRVILSGGASVMPFIGELVRSHFGEDAFGRDEAGRPRPRSTNPAFSVGEGLAFMGYVLLLKYQVRRRMETLIRDRLEQMQSTVHGILLAPFVDEGWNALIRDLDLWAEKSAFGPSLDDAIAGNGFQFPAREISAKIEPSMQTLFRDVGAKISAALKPILGEIDEPFSAGVDSKKIEEILKKTDQLKRIEYSKRVMFGFWTMMNTDMRKPVPREKRKTYVDLVRQRKSQVRASLNAQLLTRTRYALPAFNELLLDAMLKALDKYMDDIIPYFFDRYS